MIEFAGRAILLDIEGTVAPLAYVHDVMFPFVRQRLEKWLVTHWNTVELNNALEQMARDAGFGSRGVWLGRHNDAEQRALVRDRVLHWMDEDAKLTGLKSLQGLMWDDGFHAGDLKSEIFHDVPPALTRWRKAGLAVFIYSSGSIQAQKLFFGHTLHGNLLPLLDGFFDTTIGPKREAASYEAIARDRDFVPGNFLFLSDIVAELDAAAQTGMATALCLRPGNPEPLPHRHPEITTFDDVQLVLGVNPA